MFQAFIIERFFLDFTALVHGFHGTGHASAFGEPVKFLQHGFFHQVGKLFDDECSLQWILVLCQAQFVVDDELNGHGPPYRFLGWRGNGFIVGICVKGITVVINGIQCLQRGADIVEVDLLRVQ